MNTTKSSLTITLALAGAFALAGCGNDSGDHATDSGITDTGGPGPDGGGVMTDGGGMVDCIVSPENVKLLPTFTSLHSALFGNNIHCALAGCHAPTVGGGLDMSMSKDATYMALVNADTVCNGQCTGAKPMFPKRVVPGMPAKSFLYEKVSQASPAGGVGGARMPLGSNLTQCQIDVIQQWIMAGAMNN